MGKSWKKLLLVAVALAALFAISFVPAGAVDPRVTPLDAGLLRLHLGIDGTFFQYEGDDLSAGKTNPQLITQDRCLITDPNPTPEPNDLVVLDGTDRGPGLTQLAIGIKSGGSQGTSCSRTDTGEQLTVGLVGTPKAAKAEFDLELKGNAKVQIRLYVDSHLVETFEVRSGSSIVSGEGVDGTSTAPYSATATRDVPDTNVDERIANCRNAADSGPDSGISDNCRLSVDPDFPFDEVVFAPLVGEFSLEGSGDFGGMSPNLEDTVFYLTTVDGVIDCGDTVSTDPGAASGTFTRLNNVGGATCTAKPYVLNITTGTGPPVLTFIPEGDQAAVYRGFVTFGPYAPDNPTGADIEYDQDGDGPGEFELMQWCISPDFDLTGNVTSATLPETESWCIASENTQASGTKIVTIWQVFGHDDPKYR